MRVCKFGGSSLTSVKSLRNIKKLCKGKNSRRIFVFSAIGKSKGSDEKLTDLLINFFNEKNYLLKKKVYNKILLKFSKLVRQTGSKTFSKQEIHSALFSYNSIDYILSRGEYFTTKIMAEYLNIKFVPAEKVIFFENDKINYKKSKRALFRYLKKYEKIAIPGFYGIDENKKIKLFSRGGGDVSGAIISKILNATIYENWTDVCGIKEINPKIYPSPTIKKLSYTDLQLMTSLDAKVLHKDVASILNGTKTKTHVGSIFSPTKEKTIISKKHYPNVKFISYKKENENYTIYISNNGKMKIVKNISQIMFEKTIKEYYKLLKFQ